MHRYLLPAIALATIAPLPVSAQDSTPTAAPAAVPVTVEGYYRIKWGSEAEFLALYQKNHLPILEEAQARGFIQSIKVDLPFTHMVGAARWDVRVSITYRDATAAIVTDPAFASVFDEVVARLKKDNPKFDEEEATRFSLLDEHWDVVLSPQ
ncbi:MAG: hypothetical protein KJZ64_10250 [Sphingomonadaceae bacterium]|nr:hypothetical protein [Sphingomonadaceae bacterium]